MSINTAILPTTKEETWKYTNISAIYSKNKIENILRESEISDDLLSKFKSESNDNIIVIIDGVLALDYNKRLQHTSASNFTNDDRKMANVAKDNATTFEINVTKDVKEKLSLIFLNTENAQSKLTNVALKINVGMFSKLELDVDYASLSKEPTATNILLDLDLNESSKVIYTNVADNNNNKNFLITSNIVSNHSKNAEFIGFNILSKDAMLRNDFLVNLNEENSKFDTRGMYLLTNKSIADTIFLVNHNASKTSSNVNFRGVANGSSKAFFNAKAIVKKDIQEIKAFQNNKNIQLSKKAQINTKPELEIYSDDVVCTHGATIGELDKDALFYLQSRGINLKDAQHLLLESFVKSQITADDLEISQIQKEDFLDSLEDILSDITSN